MSTPAPTMDDLLDLLNYGGGELMQFATKPPGSGLHVAITPYGDRPDIDPDADCWFGANPVRIPTSTEGRSKNPRPNASEVTRLAAVWADLDVKVGGCPDYESARAIIDDLSGMLGTPPTAVVASGHGLQPYWSVTDAQVVDDEHAPDGAITRRVARATLRCWGRLVAAVAERRGSEVDSVFDLPRILRLPGSVNNKDREHPVPVTMELPGGAGIDIRSLAEVLEEQGIELLEGDFDDPGVIVAPPAEWAHGTKVCMYARKAIAGWKTDTPTARHPWLAAQLVRLACMHRNGCLTAEARDDAVDVLIDRFRELLATGQKRAEHPGEIADLIAHGTAKAAGKTPEGLAAELGNHQHRTSPGRPPVIVGDSRTGTGSAAGGTAAGGAAVPPAPLPPPAAPDTGGRPIEDVVGVADFGDKLSVNLGTGPTSGVFRLGTSLVLLRSITERGYVKPPREQRDGLETLCQLTPDSLANYLREQIYYQGTKDGVAFRTVPPQRAIKEIIADPGGAHGARVTTGVVYTPAIRVDGSILDTPGYDPESQVLYLPLDGMEDIVVPERPDQTQAIAAGALISSLVSDFNFTTVHDKANFLAALITPALQPLLDTPAPFTGITAGNVGSGKTLLSTTIARLYGVTHARGPLPKDDDEVEKQLGSIYLNTSDPVIVFDNQVLPVASPKLAPLGTSREISVRKLGSSTEIKMINNRLLIFNGNGLRIDGELARRVVMVSFDPGMPDAYNRDATLFAIPDLAAYVVANRPALLSAVLTMLRAWIVAGRPDAPYAKVEADTFSTWRRITRGVLHFAGIEGEVWTEHTTIKDGNVSEQLLYDLLSAINDAYDVGNKEWTARDMIEHLSNEHSTAEGRAPAVDWSDLLPDDMYDRRDRAVHKQRLGLYLRKHLGHWVGGHLRLVAGSRDSHGKVARYRVQDRNGDA